MFCHATTLCAIALVLSYIASSEESAVKAVRVIFFKQLFAVLDKPSFSAANSSIHEKAARDAIELAAEAFRA